MNVSASRVGLIALVVAGLLVPALAPARADDADRKKQVDDQVAAAKDELDGASKQALAAAKALKRAKREIPLAQAELSSAEKTLAGAKKRESIVAAELQAATRAVNDAKARTDVVLAQIAITQNVLTQIARTVYTQGPYGEYEVILGAKSPSELAERIASVRTVTSTQNKALVLLGEQRAELAERKAELDTAQAEVAARRDAARKNRELATSSAVAARAAKIQIDALVKSRSSAVATAAALKAAELKRLRELQAEQQRLASLLSGTGDGSAYPSGSLLWPAPGPMVQGVGPRVHPVYGYASCHTGIDISVGYGVAIKAAASGRVVDVLAGGPYGNHSVIDHGGGLATMYAHQSSVAVSPGQRVTKGQVIGYVGTTGFSTGPHLHFEVWISGKPYDPMGWFGGSRVPVAC